MRRKSANKISRKVRMSNAAKSFPESSGVNWAGVEYGEKVGKRVLVSLRRVLKLTIPQHVVPRDLEIDS